MINYTLHARAEARSDEDIALVHNRLFQYLKDHSLLCAQGTMPKAPRIRGGNLLACVDLGGFLPQGMSGDAVYMFRRRPDVSPCSGEDRITINFQADTTLHEKVIFDLVPNLIGAMRPFMLMMGDERFEEPLVQADGSIQIGGPLASGCELRPVFFLEDWWFEARYQISIQEGLRIVQPLAERASVIQDGLLVVCSAEIQDFEKAREQLLKIEAALQEAKPGFLKLIKRWFNRSGQSQSGA